LALTFRQAHWELLSRTPLRRTADASDPHARFALKSSILPLAIVQRIDRTLCKHASSTDRSPASAAAPHST
jgi:hypothetical protein